MTYSECINQISKNEIFSGLLGYGLFSERLPPFLTSETYLNFAKNNSFHNKKYSSQFVFFDNYRNTNVPRTLAIPTPFAPSLAIMPQQQLIRVIANPKLKDFNKHTFKSFMLSPNQTESK